MTLTVMKRITIFIAMTILHNACSNAQLVNGNHPDSFEQLNSTAKGRYCRIVLVDGNSFRAKKLNVAESLTTWVGHDNRPYHIPTSKIYKVSIETNKEGSKKGIGLMIGLLAGGISGYLIASRADSDDPDCEVLCFQKELNIISGVGVALLSGAFGYGIANSIGSTQNFIVNSPKETLP